MTMQCQSALAIRSLTVDYGIGRMAVRALDGVSLELPPKECGTSLVCIGRSAAGKSSLGQALLRLLPPNATVQGSIQLPGGPSRFDDPKSFREYRRTSMGCVFQDPVGSLIPGVRIGRQVQRVFQVRRRISWGDSERLARAAMAEVGLDDVDRVWRALPSELSGGMCQRIMICLALAAPQLRFLIGDEPTSSLDTVSAAQVLDQLFRVQREHGATLLVIAHDVRVVRRFDWVAVLSEGRLVEFERSFSFISGPKSDAGRRLLEASNSLAGLADGNVPSTAGELS